jgi:hypothetical protein
MMHRTTEAFQQPETERAHQARSEDEEESQHAQALADREDEINAHHGPQASEAWMEKHYGRRETPEEMRLARAIELANQAARRAMWGMR